MGRRPLCHCAAALVALVACSALACKSKDNPAPAPTAAPPSNTAASASPTSPSPAPSSLADSGEWCPNPETAGWRRWTEPKTGLSLLIPPSPAAFPKGLAWEDCPADGWFDGPCRRTVSASGKGEDKVEKLYGDATPDGAVSIGIERKCGDYSHFVFTNTEGRVQGAFAIKRDVDKGWFWLTDFKQGYWVGSMGKKGGVHSVVGGPVGTADPVVYLSRTPASNMILAYGSSKHVYVSDRPAVAVSRSGESSPVYPKGTSLMFGHAWGDYVFFAPDYDKQQKMWVWDKAAGPRPWFALENMVVASLATDSKHMAWVLRTGAGEFLAASPFSLTTAGLKPRRYMPLGHDDHSVVVGCGHAAVSVGTTKTFVARIDDGTTWTLTAKGRAKGAVPVALTCQHVLVTTTADERMEIARLQLDALGTSSANKPVPLPILSQSRLEADGEADASAAPSSAPSGAK